MCNINGATLTTIPLPDDILVVSAKNARTVAVKGKRKRNHLSVGERLLPLSNNTCSQHSPPEEDTESGGKVHTQSFF